MRASRSHRKLLAILAIAALVGILGAVLWIGFERAARDREAEQIRLRLPRLPDTEGWPEAFTEALREANSKISLREDPLANIKRLATLLHANGFLEEAASCYQALEEGQPNEPRWPYFQALVHFDRGDLASGQEALERAVSLDPSAVHVLLKLGEVRFKSGQSDSALAAYGECLRLDEGNPYALLGIAREKMRGGEAMDALSTLADLLATTPDFAPAHILMAQLYSRKGDSSKAEVSRALGEKYGRYREPRDPWMEEVLDHCYDPHRLTVLAQREMDTGLSQRARMFLDRAVAVAPNYPEAHVMLGLLLSRTGESEAAVKSFESALRMGLSNTDAHSGLARVYLERGDLSKAIKTARQGLAAFPDSPKLHTMLGGFLLKKRSLSQAEWHLRIALGKDPHNPNTIKFLGETLLRQGRETEAMEQFLELRRLAPLDTYSRLTLARYHIERGEFDQAEAPIREAGALEPEDLELRRLRLEFLVESGNRKAREERYVEAIEAYSEALSLDPERISLFRNIAFVHASLRDWESARDNLRKYLDRRPDDIESWILLGDILWSAKDPAEAKVHWLHARRLAGEQSGADQFTAIIEARLDRVGESP